MVKFIIVNSKAPEEMVVGTRVGVDSETTPNQFFHVLLRCYGDTDMFINTYACEEKTYRIRA